MARTVDFHFVDVFADAPLQGNSLALIDDGDNLDDETMKAIAREFNQSETTFILTPTDPAATVRLRSFTPNGSEVFGAGHNALGAWLWLAHTALAGPAPATGFAQQIGTETLAVELSTLPDGRAVATMRHSPPRFGAQFTDVSRLAQALGLPETAITLTPFPQVVSTGAGHLLIRLADRSAVDDAVPNVLALTEVLQESGGEGCYLYSLDPVHPDSAAYARFFNPVMGIAEDPATGTAAGPLAALLVASGLVADDSTAIIEQGYSLGRPSRIRVSVQGDDIRVSGAGIIVASGELFL